MHLHTTAQKYYTHSGATDTYMPIRVHFRLEQIWAGQS